MSDDNNYFLPSGNGKPLNSNLIVEYRVLGTIPLDELRQAIYADFNALKDIHNVQFVTGARLSLPVTDGYGQPVLIKRVNGTTMRQIHTYHYKPACKDYDL